MLRAIFALLLLTTFPTLAHQPLLANAPSVVRSDDCFSGPFSSFDSWVNQLSKWKKNFDLSRFPFDREEFNRYKTKLTCLTFIYKVDGLNVRGTLLVPAKAKGKLPTIIYNRGGNGSYGGMVFGSVMYELMPLAEQGFVVIASNYRGSKQAEISDFKADGTQDEFGGKDINDVLALVPILQSLEVADMDSLGVYGTSRGGMQTLLFARHYPDVKALATVSGSADLYTQVNNNERPEFSAMVKKRIPNFSEDPEAKLKARSPVYWADKLPDVPLLIIHSKDDERVPFAQAQSLAAAWEEQNRSPRFVVYESGGHSLDPHHEEVKRLIADFFTQHLKHQAVCSSGCAVPPCQGPDRLISQ